MPRLRAPARSVAAFTVILALCAPPLAAQDATCTVATSGSCAVDLTVRMSTASALTLAVTRQDVGLPVPALTSGEHFVAEPGPTAVVSANTGWQLMVSTSTNMWTTGASTSDKPASDLQWSLTPDGPFVPFSTVPAAVATGGRSDRYAVPVFLRASVDVARDRPGSYAITVNFTIVAP